MCMNTDEHYLPAETILQHDDVPEIAVENDGPMNTSPTSKTKSADQSHSAFCLASKPSTSASSDRLAPVTQPKETLYLTSQLKRRPNSNFEELIPIPSSGGQNKTKRQTGKPKQHSEILTGSPQKNKLEQKLLNKKHPKKSRPKEPKRKKPTKTMKAKKRSRNSKLDSDSEGSEINVNQNELCDDYELDLPGNEGEETCFVCGEFGQNGEEWYRCTGCGIWNHALCSGADSAVNYFCDICLKKQ